MQRQPVGVPGGVHRQFGAAVVARAGVAGAGPRQAPRQIGHCRHQRLQPLARLRRIDAVHALAGADVQQRGGGLLLGQRVGLGQPFAAGGPQQVGRARVGVAAFAYGVQRQAHVQAQAQPLGQRQAAQTGFGGGVLAQRVLARQRRCAGIQPPGQALGGAGDARARQHLVDQRPQRLVNAAALALLDRGQLARGGQQVGRRRGARRRGQPQRQHALQRPRAGQHRLVGAAGDGQRAFVPQPGDVLRALGLGLALAHTGGVQLFAPQQFLPQRGDGHRRHAVRGALQRGPRRLHQPRAQPLRQAGALGRAGDGDAGYVQLRQPAFVQEAGAAAAVVPQRVGGAGGVGAGASLRPRAVGGPAGVAAPQHRVRLRGGAAAQHLRQPDRQPVAPAAVDVAVAAGLRVLRPLPVQRAKGVQRGVHPCLLRGVAAPAVPAPATAVEHHPLTDLVVVGQALASVELGADVIGRRRQRQPHDGQRTGLLQRALLRADGKRRQRQRRPGQAQHRPAFPQPSGAAVGAGRRQVQAGVAVVAEKLRLLQALQVERVERQRHAGLSRRRRVAHHAFGVDQGATIAARRRRAGGGFARATGGQRQRGRAQQGQGAAPQRPRVFRAKPLLALVQALWSAHSSIANGVYAWAPAWSAPGLGAAGAGADAGGDGVSSSSACSQRQSCFSAL